MLQVAIFDAMTELANQTKTAVMAKMTAVMELTNQIVNPFAWSLNSVAKLQVTVHTNLWEYYTFIFSSQVFIYIAGHLKFYWKWVILNDSKINSIIKTNNAPLESPMKLQLEFWTKKFIENSWILEHFLKWKYFWK